MLLQSMGSQGVGQDLVTEQQTILITHLENPSLNIVILGIKCSTHENKGVGGSNKHLIHNKE